MEGFSPEALRTLRQQSAELKRLQKLDTATQDQQQQITRLHTSLQKFERKVIHSAIRLEKQSDWHGAEQLLRGATRVYPDSQLLVSTQRQLAERRQLREERVRMELAIQQGEQLLKDAEAYQQLRQLQGPGLLNWLELKHHLRKSRESAQALQKYSQRALAREDYVLARRGLEIAQRLYSEDAQKDSDQLEQIERDLAMINRQLQPPKPQPVSIPKVNDDITVTELQQALETGDLVSARQHLNRLQQQSPEHPQLLPLQSRFHIQLNNRVQAAIKQGNDLYSQGRIEPALEVWRQTRILAPDNIELLGNILRAEKVLENLKALSIPSSTP
ncbi:hypothetical protein PVT68_05610 [Microbulbifer bruguierae]|uniref:Uncharacterized protein n=1 Tax=Microbulbifer bruguierae TaxID=3029061 RepID=A0ABY8NGF6_9GAMM|nr:hypothetical protein [Microbulbifer bruguierae]WGL17770.1 hypothetical protein PVT68_05610 [Microbulbifer bruguierae]